MALYNTYDQRIYGVGKGASETTITAPYFVLWGSGKLKGTILDVSPGTESCFDNSFSMWCSGYL